MGSGRFYTLNSDEPVNRSSLAALGPQTQHHFGIDATALSMFTVIQLVIYAALQIPVGILLDRFGATVMLLSGSTLMFVGQFVMATVDDVRLAILARVLVGAGDACTFISVIRLLPEWFSLRQLPIVSQATGQVGQLGQLVSVIPLAMVVDEFGWAAGFMGVAAVGVIAVILGALVLRDRPGEGTAVERLLKRRGAISREARSFAGRESTAMLAAVAPPPTEVVAVPEGRPDRRPDGLFRRLRRVVGLPGVRVAFWVHFTTPFPASVLLLLWGTPFFTGGVGLAPAASAGLLSLAVVSALVAGGTLGPLTSRFVERRVRIVQVVTLMIIAVWLVVLIWPATPPVWLLVVLVLVVPIGGPASMIAFEVVRSHAPRSYLGLATGFINMGGFISALLAVFFIGVALDLQGAGSPEHYSLTAFRWAFLTQVPIWALGLVMMAIELRRTRAWMERLGRTLR
ncbi:MAG: MFS transporter [Leucobacter sp.]|nr:MFS transporter [Leucobacter sp.]